jgi:hypothetical protein
MLDLDVEVHGDGGPVDPSAVEVGALESIGLASLHRLHLSDPMGWFGQFPDRYFLGTQRQGSQRGHPRIRMGLEPIRYFSAL